MSGGDAQIVVIAKEPREGFVKTRLVPPCTSAEAAEIARASLVQTLEVVASVPASRRVVALDGEPGPWLPAGFEVMPQRPGSLGDRLQGVFDDCFALADQPVMIIGMDTPQVTPTHLTQAAARLADGSTAVLGPASDGGYWLIGLAYPRPNLFSGVEMSTERTMQQQVDTLERLDYRIAAISVLRDIDRAEDARAVADALPSSGFASVVHRILGP
jgi:rSAM/selenodomain-associated transferase 1